MMDYLIPRRISSILDPIFQIRSTCSRVAALASHVQLDDNRISEVATEFKTTDFESLRNGVTWDSSGWHYNADAVTQGPLTCQYVFVMDALNFCFWPCPGLEYDTLATSLKAVLENDNAAFDAERLLSMNELDLAEWFPKRYQLPHLTERLERLHELGSILAEEFSGQAVNMVRAAGGSATKLVQLIIRYIPGFRDTSVYQGKLVHFYKRAQILVGDVWAAYGRQAYSHDASISSHHPYAFYDIDQLTMFADYRVPQILREMGIMKYSHSLAERIDSYSEIGFGSEEEIEIRALTIIAVDKLHAALAALGVSLLVIEVDWLLWQKGELLKDSIKPHHRTKTIYY